MKCEIDLIEKAKEGNQDAFEQIVDLYKNYVYAIILNFIKDREEAENVAQEVFLQIYLSLPKYKSDNFKGWISRISSNKAIDHIRKKKTSFKEKPAEITEDLMQDIKNLKNETPEEMLIEKEKTLELEKICASLPRIYEDTIRKFYLEGKSYEEISKEESVTVKTIASRLYRGKNLLRKKWREKDETL